MEKLAIIAINATFIALNINGLRQGKIGSILTVAFCSVCLTAVLFADI